MPKSHDGRLHQDPLLEASVHEHPTAEGRITMRARPEHTKPVHLSVEEALSAMLTRFNVLISEIDECFKQRIDYQAKAAEVTDIVFKICQTADDGRAWASYSRRPREFGDAMTTATGYTSSTACSTATARMAMQYSVRDDIKEKLNLKSSEYLTMLDQCIDYHIDQAAIRIFHLLINTQGQDVLSRPLNVNEIVFEKIKRAISAKNVNLLTNFFNIMYRLQKDTNRLLLQYSDFNQVILSSIEHGLPKGITFGYEYVRELYITYFNLAMQEQMKVGARAMQETMQAQLQLARLQQQKMAIAQSYAVQVTLSRRPPEKRSFFSRKLPQAVAVEQSSYLDASRRVDDQMSSLVSARTHIPRPQADMTTAQVRERFQAFLNESQRLVQEQYAPSQSPELAAEVERCIISLRTNPNVSLLLARPAIVPRRGDMTCFGSTVAASSVPEAVIATPLPSAAAPLPIAAAAFPGSADPRPSMVTHPVVRSFHHVSYPTSTTLYTTTPVSHQLLGRPCTGGYHPLGSVTSTHFGSSIPPAVRYTSRQVLVHHEADVRPEDSASCVGSCPGSYVRR